MNAAGWIAIAVLWLVVVGLAVAVLALARQIGILHQRLPQAGALKLGTGAAGRGSGAGRRGERLHRSPLRIGGADPSNADTLLVFVSPSCPVCKTLLPALRSIRRREQPRVRSSWGATDRGSSTRTSSRPNTWASSPTCCPRRSDRLRRRSPAARRTDRWRRYRPRQRAREFARAPRQPVRSTRARGRFAAGVDAGGRAPRCRLTPRFRRESSMTDLDSLGGAPEPQTGGSRVAAQPAAGPRADCWWVPPACRCSRSPAAPPSAGARRRTRATRRAATTGATARSTAFSAPAAAGP